MRPWLMFAGGVLVVVGSRSNCSPARASSAKGLVYMVAGALALHV